MNRLIPRIYNYCDRWCDRCHFTNRCKIFQRELKELKESGPPENLPEILAAVNTNVSATLRLMHVTAEVTEAEMDGRPVIEEAAMDDIMEKLPEEPSRLVESCLDYGSAVDVVSDRHEELFFTYQDELISQLKAGLDMGSAMRTYMKSTMTIEWFQHFLYVKSRRAVQQMNKDFSDHPVQNDMNGTAKVMLLGCRQSIGAWRVLYELFPEIERDTLRMLQLLASIEQVATKLFPRADAFVRPGFDEW